MAVADVGDDAADDDGDDAQPDGKKHQKNQTLSRAEHDLAEHRDDDGIDNGGDETLDYGQFRFQLDSLQQNFETIEAINPTSLSKNQAMNYQVYRQNLNAVIYKATSYVNALRVNQTETPKDTDKLHVDLGARQNFYQGVGSSLNVIKSDLKVLENNKSLYDQDYKKNSKILEEQK